MSTPDTMTADQLRQLKREWYERGRRDGSIALCALVARTLGTEQAAKYPTKYRWEEGGVSIFLDGYGRYMTVEADGKRVCCTHTCGELFVPGQWVEVVKAAAARAKAKTEGDEHRREEQERAKLLSELGLGQEGGASS